MTAIADLIALANEYDAPTWSVEKHVFPVETGEAALWDGMDVRIQMPQGFQVGSFPCWRRDEEITPVAIEQALGEAVGAIRKEIESRMSAGKTATSLGEFQRRSSQTGESAKAMIAEIGQAYAEAQGDVVLMVTPYARRGFYLVDINQGGVVFHDKVIQTSGAGVRQSYVGFTEGPAVEKEDLLIIIDKDLNVPWRLAERESEE